MHACLSDPMQRLYMCRTAGIEKHLEYASGRQTRDQGCISLHAVSILACQQLEVLHFQMGATQQAHELSFRSILCNRLAMSYID